MESTFLSEHLLDYMEQHKDISKEKSVEITKGTIEVFGKFFYEFSVPDTWQIIDIERIECHTIIFHWRSTALEAVCPECGMPSSSLAKRFFPRQIQDLPMAGMTVYHIINRGRFYCENAECTADTFFEQFEEIAEKDARLTYRLKDFVVRYAIESSCNGAAGVLRKIGIRVSRDTIIRTVKKKGALAVTENLSRKDVRVLSVDDINLRKGNSSTACSVFIDGETHRVLAIVQGATSEIAEKVIGRYPSIEMVSRDRGSAFSSAADKFNKPQVADGFHLIQNIHKVVKDVLSLEIGNDIFIRQGDSWISMVDSSNEGLGSADLDKDCLVFFKPAGLTEEDMERRIELAGLKNMQAQKYRKTMKILELTESGLRTAEITKRLSMKKIDVINYRKNAPETIEKVEVKIDEYYEMHEKGQWEYHQKTIAPNAKHSSESIVEPFKETVLKMLNEGKNHRDIHPVIVMEGFKGSANAVYQYLIKYSHENNFPYGHNSRVIPLEDRQQQIEPRPPRISIERVSRDTVYEAVLRAASEKSDEIKQTLQKLDNSPKHSQDKKKQSELEDWVNKTNYSDSIANIIFDTRPKNKSPKKN